MRTDAKRPCPVCGEGPTPEGYDPCVGYLPGARFVCCGHVDTEWRYVSTITGRRFGGLPAFQRHQQWLATPEARMAMHVDELGLADTFGWTERGFGRSCCNTHGVMRFECGHALPGKVLGL